MIAFKQHLEESLNSAYHWKHSATKHFEGGCEHWYVFVDNENNRYSVAIQKSDDGIVDLTFQTNGMYRKSISISNPLKIYGTIAVIFKKFMESNRSSVDIIRFDSFSSAQDSLYRKFVHRMAAEFNGEVEEDRNGFYRIRL